MSGGVHYMAMSRHLPLAGGSLAQTYQGPLPTVLGRCDHSKNSSKSDAWTWRWEDGRALHGSHSGNTVDWVNYKDFTATYLGILVNKGNHAFMAELAELFRLVNYFNLARRSMMQTITLKKNHTTFMIFPCLTTLH